MNKMGSCEPNLIEIGKFKQRLGETIAWCIHRALRTSPRDSLRTSELRPRDQLHWVSHSERSEITTTLFRERARLLRMENVPAYSGRNALAEGRLLLFDPVGSLSDGGSEAASEGFFDDGNIPAWDTWVYYDVDNTLSEEAFFSSFLVSWIPPSFVRLVNNGVEVNPEGSISWASNVDIGFTRALKAQGLLP